MTLAKSFLVAAAILVAACGQSPSGPSAPASAGVAGVAGGSSTPAPPTSLTATSSGVPVPGADIKIESGVVIATAPGYLGPKRLPVDVAYRQGVNMFKIPDGMVAQDVVDLIYRSSANGSTALQWLTYAVKPTVFVPAAGSPPEFVQLVREEAEHLARVSGRDVRFAEAPVPGTATIMVYIDPGKVPAGFGAFADIRSSAEGIQSGSLYFRDGTVPRSYMRHEMGHALGLRHSHRLPSIMGSDYIGAEDYSEAEKSVIAQMFLFPNGNRAEDVHPSLVTSGQAAAGVTYTFACR